MSTASLAAPCVTGLGMIFIMEGERLLIGLCSGVVLVIRPSGCPAEPLLAMARLMLSDADLTELTKRLADEDGTEI
jgi:hypothetical protein